MSDKERIKDLEQQLRATRELLRFEVLRGNELEQIVHESLLDMGRWAKEIKKTLPVKKKKMILAT